MTARTVRGYVEFPVGSGSPCVEARIVATLHTGVAGTITYGTVNDFAVGSAATLTNGDGFWLLDLEPNSVITPEGTAWLIQINPPDRDPSSFYIEVPDSVGPHDATDLVVGEPVALPSPPSGDAAAKAWRVAVGAARIISVDPHDGFDAVGDGVTDDSTAIRNAALAAGEGEVVLSAVAYNVGAGLSLDGCACSFRGSGEGTELVALTQDGPVLDLTGYISPSNFQYQRHFTDLTIRGNNTADATLANVGLYANDIHSISFARIAIIATGGPCLSISEGLLVTWEDMVFNRPVGADTNDVPYIYMIESANSHMFTRCGFRSVSSDDDGMAVVRMRSGPNFACFSNMWTDCWTEFTHTPDGGAIFDVEGNQNEWRGTTIWDPAAKGLGNGGSSGETCIWRFRTTPRANFGGNVVLGYLGGRNPSHTAFDYGIITDQPNNAFIGTQGFASRAVLATSAAARTAVIVMGAESTPSPPAVVDNSSPSTMSIIDMTYKGTVGLRVNGAVVGGAYATGSRPSASAVGAGAMVYDTTLGKPIWSNGTAWKDATGTTV